MIWKSPVYRFRVPIEENSNELKEIVIDVTGSAPNFEDVKDSMSNVFEKLLESEECKNVQRVLDFGQQITKHLLFLE